jgi:hypothetical protein
MPGFELEGRIEDVSTPVLRVRVKPAALKAEPATKRRRA